MAKEKVHQAPIQTATETPRLPIRTAMDKALVLPPAIRIRMETLLHNNVAIMKIHLSGHGNFKIIQVMKKMVLTMLCMMALNANAQVYAYDTWTQLPTTDLYDTQTMNMALAHAEMRARVDT